MDDAWNTANMDSRWNAVGMELIGPFPVTHAENKFVCVVTCLFSKFVYARAVPDKSAQSTCEVLIEVCHLYGPPKCVLTDQEEEYRTQVGLYSGGSLIR